MDTERILANPTSRRLYVSAVILQSAMTIFGLLVFIVSLVQQGPGPDVDSTNRALSLITQLGSIAIPFVFTVLLELLTLTAILRCQFASVKAFVLLSGIIYVLPLLITVGGALLGIGALVFVVVLAMKSTILVLSSRLSVA